MLFLGSPDSYMSMIFSFVTELLFAKRIIPRCKGISISIDEILRFKLSNHPLDSVLHDALERAAGGVLYVDSFDLYNQPYKKEVTAKALASLKEMVKTQYDSLFIILSGNDDDMDHLLSLDPELAYYFPYHIVFPTYSAEESMERLDQLILQDRRTITSEAREFLYDVICQNIEAAGRRFSNSKYLDYLMRQMRGAIEQRGINETEYSLDDIIIAISTPMELFDSLSHLRYPYY